jgi:copper transporter 1
MLFTWDTTNLCIVFRSWRVTGLATLILSLIAVMALTAGYEAVREASRRYEDKQRKLIEEMPSKPAPEPGIEEGVLLH